MSNISEQYRKPLMSDETGKAIADKLSGDSTEAEGVNLSEQYRKPLMSEETARDILSKIDSGSGLPDVTSEDNGDVLGVVEGAWAKMNVPIEPISFRSADLSNDVKKAKIGQAIVDSSYPWTNNNLVSMLHDTDNTSNENTVVKSESIEFENKYVGGKFFIVAWFEFKWISGYGSNFVLNYRKEAICVNEDNHNDVRKGTDVLMKGLITKTFALTETT